MTPSPLAVNAATPLPLVLTKGVFHRLSYISPAYNLCGVLPRFSLRLHRTANEPR